MGKSIDSSIRLKVVEAWQCEKLKYSELSKRFNLNYNTVRSICLDYKESGISALSTDYSNCGKKTSLIAEKVYRLVRLIRHFHPQWGVPYILTRVKLGFPQLELQSVRKYQRRLKKDQPKKKLPAAVVPKVKPEGSIRQAHDEWQVDAKERIGLPSGIKTCFLNITDTRSHGILKAKPFPPRAYQSGRNSTHSVTITRFIQRMGITQGYPFR